MFAGNSGAKSRTVLSSITLDWSDAQLSGSETAHLSSNLPKCSRIGVTKVKNRILIPDDSSKWKKEFTATFPVA
jgi:hypothetical protein